MSYSKTTWVDQATPLSAANMNKIENELVALDSGKVNEPSTDGTAGQVLTTDGAGGRSWTTMSAGSDITVDSSLSDTSTNPVQNCVINSAIMNKANKPTLISSGANITVADNTEYRLSDVTSLTLTYPEGNFECWMRFNTASSGNISIVLPESSTYVGYIPEFGNSETWELSIKDGIVIAQMIGDV